MKNSEFKRLVAEYKERKTKSKKSNDKRLQEKLSQIEHRYYHETGSTLEQI
ncbi:hypothetical protein [Nitrosopumilus sp.]|uniref:hypothetical protein n=1 Tax=Nitrosopumilus sp. TaxID=2024843 RepID=UPI0029319ECC|nr:hypothetical protein [Nitrosopumilus sp.]